MKIKVDVTQQDIDKGVQCSSARCPIAIAAKRVLGKEVSVGSMSLVIYTPIDDELEDGAKNAEVVQLPHEAQAFVRDFDHYEYQRTPISPVSFEIEVKS